MINISAFETFHCDDLQMFLCQCHWDHTTREKLIQKSMQQQNNDGTHLIALWRAQLLPAIK